ncbi:hypothetical protein Hanom_Chr11g00977071 [Helianthus anomalus]
MICASLNRWSRLNRPNRKNVLVRFWQSNGLSANIHNHIYPVKISNHANDFEEKLKIRFKTPKSNTLTVVNIPVYQ